MKTLAYVWGAILGAYATTMAGVYILAGVTPLLERMGMVMGVMLLITLVFCGAVVGDE